VVFPLVRPMPLLLLPAAFNYPAVMWEVKHDGFRGLAYVERGRCRLFSRAGHPFGQFDDVALAIGRCRSAVLDGELVVLGADGRSRFRPLLARRGLFGSMPSQSSGVTASPHTFAGGRRGHGSSATNAQRRVNREWARELPNVSGCFTPMSFRSQCELPRNSEVDSKPVRR
jgi:hypothetical protein